MLDASVTISWCFSDERAGYGMRVLELLATDAEALVPAIWPFEIVNACLVAEGRRLIAPADTLHYLNEMAALPITILPPPSSFHAFEAVMNLGRGLGLAAYDAAYLELALREGVPLATIDSDLRASARKARVSTSVR